MKSRTIVRNANQCRHVVMYSYDMKRQKTKVTLLFNLARLMDMSEMGVSELSSKSGVSKRMIQFVLKGERVPSIDITDQLASAFNLTGWQLITPNLIDGKSELKHIEKLIDDWQNSDAEGKLYIESTAKREATRKH